MKNQRWKNPKKRRKIKMNNKSVMRRKEMMKQ